MSFIFMRTVVRRSLVIATLSQSTAVLSYPAAASISRANAVLPAPAYVQCAPVSRKLFHTSFVAMGDLSADFAKAQQDVLTLKEAPSNDVKLKLYALFKQAQSGKCNTPQPGRLQFVDRAKWNAWNELGDISKEAAMKQYVDYVASLLKNQQPSETAAASNSAEKNSSPTTSSDYKDVMVTIVDGVLTCKFNRPNKKNAFTVNTYKEVSRALDQAAQDPNVRVAVLTGAGDSYSSGNDLTNFTNIPDGGIEQLAADSRELLYGYVKSYIHFPKLLVAAVNGPALGIAVTVLGLADVVYASPTATFQTPFTSLGQSPEGCSSYVFPAIMGPVKANGMLLLGQKLDAAAAERSGLVSEVLSVTGESFQAEIQKRAAQFAQLPPQSLRISKGLIKERQLGILDEVNRKECDILAERWLSDECMTAIMNFMSRSRK